MGAKNKDLPKFADLLVKGTEGLFTERSEIKFSKPTEKIAGTIVEYKGKMQADGMEKFNNEAAYVSAVNYYLNAADMAKNKAIGALIVYVPQLYMAKIMKHLKYPPIDDENENALLDSCGTLCNILAGRYKSEIASAGYIELEMSHFKTYRNNAVPGVDFCASEYDSFTINFYLEGDKRMVFDMSMGVVPTRK
jgi:hypothetical protein